MGKTKAFSNPKYRLSGSKNQGFGQPGKVKPGGRVSRANAFPEGPGNVLNSDEAFSTFKRSAKSNGSREARATAADKRDSYSRTRAQHSDSDDDSSHSDSHSESEASEEESEPDSDDLEGETAKERRRQQKREGKKQAPTPARVLGDVAKAALERSEREKARLREPIVLSNSDDDAAAVALEQRMMRQLSPNTYAAHVAATSKAAALARIATAGPSSSPIARHRNLAPSPDKKPLFRTRSPSISDSDSDARPPPKRFKPAPNKQADPRLSRTRVGARKFVQKSYDAAPELDPAIEALVAVNRERSEEPSEVESDDEGEAGKIQRRERREKRRLDDMDKAAKARKKVYREARGPGYSNPRRN